MDDKDMKVVEEVTQSEDVQNVAPEVSVDEKPIENEGGGKKFGGLIGKFQKFTKEKPQIWQVIKFTLVSMLAGLTEIISFAILTASLRNVDSPINWFILRYPTSEGGLGTMVSYLVSTSLAQIVAFVINRKKTFKSNNNIVFSITAYAVMVVVFIVGLQMYTAPLMIAVFDKGINNHGLSTALVKALWMLFSFIITFVCSKYVIMREVKPKASKGKDDAN